MRIRLALLALLVLSGCGSGDDPAVAIDATTTTADAPTELHLAADGLVVDGEQVPFGTPADEALELVGEALGEPTDQGDQAECPAGPARYARFGELPDGVLLTLQEDELVGWSTEDATLTTAEGIGVGSTKAELEEAYGPAAVVPDSTIGIELGTLDGLSALLTENAPDGTLTHLWAGTTCIFR